MDRNKQLIAIAEATGDWKNCRVIKGQHGDFDEVVGFGTYDDGSLSDSEDPVPLYDISLDAIQEAVMLQCKNANFCPIDYTDTLLYVVRADSGVTSERGCFAHTNATAPQRCEAFLRVLGLWEESA